MNDEVLAVYVEKRTTLKGDYSLEAVWVPGVKNGMVVGQGMGLAPGVYRVVDPGDFAKENPGVKVELMTKGGGLPDPPGTLAAVLGQPQAAVRQQLHALLFGQGDEVVIYKKP
ncbi:MAG TPA: hypothetical protein VLT45_28410 [Kofleriaceae bacterium]|nr:hypothetical protein [Kofleriaceae bacterium]